MAIGKFSRQAAGIHRGLPPRQLACFACSFSRSGRFNALANDAARHRGMLVEPFAQPFVDELLDVALDVAVELTLGLPLELRLRQAHAHHRYQTFAYVVTGYGDFVLLLFQHAGRGSEIVDRARQRRSKPGKMRAAVNGIDRVGEREDVFAIAVVVLQRDFDLDVAALSLYVDGRIVQRTLAAIQMLHEFADAASEAKLGRFFGALVREGDLQALVKKG